MQNLFYIMGRLSHFLYHHRLPEIKNRLPVRTQTNGWAVFGCFVNDKLFLSAGESRKLIEVIMR